VHVGAVRRRHVFCRTRMGLLAVQQGPASEAVGRAPLGLGLLRPKPTPPKLGAMR
ncbi:unnamed protein product, partial [Amoebophrya sp. A120]